MLLPAPAGMAPRTATSAGRGFPAPRARGDGPGWKRVILTFRHCSPRCCARQLIPMQCTEAPAVTAFQEWLPEPSPACQPAQTARCHTWPCAINAT